MSLSFKKIIISWLLLASQSVHSASADAPNSAVFPDKGSFNYFQAEPYAGYHRWALRSSMCNYCAIKIVPQNSFLLKNDVYIFLTTLTESKFELLDLYGIHGQEYNLLALIAVGILGRETSFFESPRYQFKEAFPGLISEMKIISSALKNKQLTANSRGPTQIKIVPLKIQQRYGFLAKDLSDPRNAALATMGYLIEALTQLRVYVKTKSLRHITIDKIPDYLPYIYFGATKALISKTATPERNIYVQDMKKYMGWVQLYEKN
ncbi:MAG: hypothetical protein WA160_12530 [Pseudobdellovibrio sp.]